MKRTSKKSSGASTAKSRSATAATPQILGLTNFVRMFKDSVLDKHNTRYCFILGSGASITSGVQTGAQLVDWWLRDLFQDKQPNAAEEKLRSWVEGEFAGVHGFTWDKRAEFYGQVYKRRFPDDASGQAWLRRRMEGKAPSFGYSVLARVLSQTRHNLVVTTNFDNLVHDAVTVLPCPHPFIAHSPEDARFLADHDGKIRIIKLHGDIDRETYNADKLISDLAKDWHEPLRHLLGSYTPVFLGYGGCDPGFMKFLTSEFLPVRGRHRPVWAYRVDTDALKKISGSVSEPPGRPDTDFCRDFMSVHNNWWMPCPGFDELMVLLGHALEYPHAGKEIRANAERAAEKYKSSLTEALKAARSHDGSRWCPQLDQMTRSAEQALLGEVKLRRWSEWRDYIEAAVSPKEERERCKAAIAEFPDDPRPYARLAWAISQVNPSDPHVAENLDLSKQRLEGKYDAESPEALYVRNLQALVLRDQGKHAEAEKEHRAVLAIRERVLGPEHLDTLASRNNLALALDAQGKHAEAEKEHRAVLTIRERVLGPEHPDTLTSRNNLASALDAQGKHAEAEKEHRAVLAIRERVSGPEHPNTLRSRSNLAAALYAQGKYAEAEKEHRPVLAIHERVLGPEHPDTLTNRNNLALALYARGKHAEAEKEHRAVLVIRERVLGPEHPDTLSSRNNLAFALDGQGKYAEAEKEYRAALAIYERVLGPEHAGVYQSCYNLALCLETQDKKAEALSLARRARHGWQKTLGEAHPRTRAAQKLVERLEKAQ